MCYCGGDTVFFKFVFLVYLIFIYISVSIQCYEYSSNTVLKVNSYSRSWQIRYDTQIFKKKYIWDLTPQDIHCSKHVYEILIYFPHTATCSHFLTLWAPLLYSPFLPLRKWGGGGANEALGCNHLLFSFFKTAYGIHKSLVCKDGMIWKWRH